MKKILFALTLSIFTQKSFAVYKPTGLGPDLCPVQNTMGMVTEYMTSRANSSNRQTVGEIDISTGPLPEPYSEGCHTLKVIYVNNLLSALQMNKGENRICSLMNPNNCTIIIGRDEIQKHYNNITTYIKRTQKTDVKNAISNKEENIVPLIINQLQHVALVRYGEGTSSGSHPSDLVKVNSNIRDLFNVDLNLKGYELDREKTEICMDFNFRCAMEANDPSRMSQKCRQVLSSPRPDFCSNQNNANNAEGAPAAPVAPVVAQLSPEQADEYLFLNRDVLKAFESKPATDTRTKIQYASQHYHERSELEGRPRSVKEYLDCNPRSVGLGFYGPENSNTDEAKTDIKAFVEKHFRLLIQTIVPVSARNFKTFGCIDLTRYLSCYSDVRNQCAQGLAHEGGDKYTAAMRACAFDHYNSFGKNEGRDGVKMCN